jgi:hypothetical protein
MVIEVTLDGYLSVRAIIDTGAPYCVLAPIFADDLRVHERFAHVGRHDLHVRGSWYPGYLYRIPATLRPFQGADITVEATFFVPQLRESEDWLHPNFLGLSGFLERIRFAVDPQFNYFYFGLGATQPAAATV